MIFVFEAKLYFIVKEGGTLTKCVCTMSKCMFILSWSAS